MKTYTPKTVIIGSSGFIGSGFSSFYRTIYSDCYCLDKRVVNDTTLFFDLMKPDISSLKLAEKDYKDALILAAVSKVDKCEKERELTKKINVDGTLELVRQLVDEGIRPIYFSSDYVFSGEGGKYSDDAKVCPVTEYGRQKAEVEEKIKEVSKNNYLVIRMSKVFSLEKNDGTLLDEMAGILASEGTIRSAYDQIFCPTLLQDIIRAVVLLQSKSFNGIVNVCSPEAWSRYDLALRLAGLLKIDPSRVLRVSLDEIGFKSKRPKDTSMIPERLLTEVGFDFTPIMQCVESVAKNWLGNEDGRKDTH